MWILVLSLIYAVSDDRFFASTLFKGTIDHSHCQLVVSLHCTHNTNGALLSTFNNGIQQLYILMHTSTCTTAIL